MNGQKLLERYRSLSATSRRRIDALVASIEQAEQPTKRVSKAPLASIAEEPFVGMWSDRPEMADSVEWVRDLRRQQWTR